MARAADAREKAQRNADDECARAAHNEERESAVDPVRPVRGSAEGEPEERHRDAEHERRAAHRRRIHLRKAGDERLGTGLARAGVLHKIKDLGNSGDTGALGSYGAASDMAANVANIAGDTSNISDSLDVSEEDLKYLRDIAEQEAINRFTTAEIKVDMSGMSNTVHNTNDLDGIVDGLTTRVLEAMEIVRDGA